MIKIFCAEHPLYHELVILAAVWAPQIQKFDSLFKYLQIVISYIGPPVVAAFVLGLFWHRANGHGAFAGFVYGAIYAVVFVMFGDQIAAGVHNIAPGFAIYNAENGEYYIHFLHVATILFFTCMIVIAIVSLLTSPLPEEKVAPLTWTKKIWNEETIELAKIPWYRNYRILSVLLLIPTAIIVIWFW